MPRKSKFDGDRDLYRAAAFDYIIGNSDRHDGNWFVGHDKLQLIDHGLAFPDHPFRRFLHNGPYDNNTLFQKEVMHRETAYPGGGHPPPSPSDEAKPYVDNKEKILNALKSYGDDLIDKFAIEGVGEEN